MESYTPASIQTHCPLTARACTIFLFFVHTFISGACGVPVSGIVLHFLVPQQAVLLGSSSHESRARRCRDCGRPWTRDTCPQPQHRHGCLPLRSLPRPSASRCPGPPRCIFRDSIGGAADAFDPHRATAPMPSPTRRPPAWSGARTRTSPTRHTQTPPLDYGTLFMRCTGQRTLLLDAAPSNALNTAESAGPRLLYFRHIIFAAILAHHFYPRAQSKHPHVHAESIGSCGLRRRS